MNPKLIVEEFWKKTTDDWTYYYIRCSGKIFNINGSMKLVEVPSIPQGAIRIELVDKYSPDTLEKPSKIFLDEICDVRSELGDDTRIFLRNGCMIFYYLEANPNYSPAISYPILNFCDKEALQKYDITDNPEEMQRLPIIFLDS